MMYKKDPFHTSCMAIFCQLHGCLMSDNSTSYNGLISTIFILDVSVVLYKYIKKRTVSHNNNHLFSLIETVNEILVHMSYARNQD